MPIYEYKCDKCGIYEVTQRITESPLKKCPTCGRKTERILSRSSFVLKGSGWYQTDYGRKGSSVSESSTSNGSTSTSSSTESSKPAASSESKSTSEKSTSEKSPAKAAS